MLNFKQRIRNPNDQNASDGNTALVVGESPKWYVSTLKIRSSNGLADPVQLIVCPPIDKWRIAFNNSRCPSPRTFTFHDQVRRTLQLPSSL